MCIRDRYDTKVYQNIGDLAQYAMGIIGTVTGSNVNENNFGLDFKLDQWEMCIRDRCRCAASARAGGVSSASSASMVKSTRPA